MLIRRFSLCAAICLFLGLSACTTYIEDRASAEFEPVFPTVDLVADSSNKTGAIYEQGQSGLTDPVHKSHLFYSNYLQPNLQLEKQVQIPH